MKESIRRKDKKLVGIGGMRCPCCTPAKPAETKVMLSRSLRRKGKQELNARQDSGS